MQPHRLNILDGSTFMVSDQRGDVELRSDVPTGLFYQDMRHLSRWQIRLNGRALEVLTAELLNYDEAVFFLIHRVSTGYRRPSLSLVRRRHLADGLQEGLELTNHSDRAVRLELELLFGADFADIFEIKDELGKAGQVTTWIGPDQAVLTYRRADFRRDTIIRATGGWFTEESVAFRIDLAPGQRWQGEIEISMAAQRRRSEPRRSHQPNMAATLADWLAAAPRLDTGSDDLRRTYQRSLVDLAALRFYPEALPDPVSLPAAGLPWYMALFGRDSLIASYQALPFVPELAQTTLRALAAWQASRSDDVRDAEPGKILHELRHGELVYFGQRPQSPYYGSCDGTPLFLIVLDEYERWTGDAGLVCELEPAARAALRWIEVYGDVGGTGFLGYRSRNPTGGLQNQGWKDSPNAIVWPDGSLVDLPRYTCELQGYAYDARLRTARLARTCWHDPALADRLERDAAALRDRFVARFWLPERGWYALALDGQQRAVDTLASNIGHLLWSGIVPEEHVDHLTGHVLGPDLFSGWGVRTLAAGQDAYNPMEYHKGTVWPHDNSIIAAGLVRYGRRAEAGRLATALLATARHFDYRLPEVFMGYDRAATQVPVPYPTACSPQAWASGAPLLLLRVLLGLEPTATGLRVDPAVPPELGRLALHGVPGRWGTADAVGH